METEKIDSQVNELFRSGILRLKKKTWELQSIGKLGSKDQPFFPKAH